MTAIRTGRDLAKRAADLEAIGRRLLAARTVAGLRAKDLAAAAGLQANTISMWENAARRPSIDQLAQALPILRVTLDWVYFGDDRGLDWKLREEIAAALSAMPATAEAISQAG